MHRRDGQLIVSATDLVGFLACGHLTHLERAAADDLVDKPDRADDPGLELLRRRGGMHEARYIEVLRARGRDITDLRHARLETDERDRRPYRERAAETIDHMRAGTDVIYQATVFDGRWVGHPDFLLRKPSVREGGSGGTLGSDFYYEVADTKLAHGVKAAALLQIASYVEQVDRIQGYAAPSVLVVTGGETAAEHTFRTAEMQAYYRRAKERFEAAIDAARVGSAVFPVPRDLSYPDPVEHCGVCKWFYQHCRQQWRDDDALALVASISRRQRAALQASSVTTMQDLSELTRPFQVSELKPKHHAALWKVREQARLQTASRVSGSLQHEIIDLRDADGAFPPNRGLTALPEPTPHDIFFDIEGDPFAFWQGMEYLFGVWEPGRGEDGWLPLWALSPAEEKVQFERLMDVFVERWRANPSMHIYHYGSYEPGRIKRLAGRHATRQREVDDLLRGRVFVDLHQVVRQGVIVGSEGYSIKSLEPLYDFRREVDLRTAGDSIAEFELWLDNWERKGEDDRQLRHGIELYNRDDCESTRRLRDWLEGLRDEAAARYGALPRPRDDAQPPQELKPWDLQLADLIGRLTAGIPEDPDPSDDTAQATWLVANLLDFHRREDRASWWRFFELMTMTDDELFAENEPIGRLRLVSSRPSDKTPEKLVHTYAFDAQEHKVGSRSRLYDPRLPPFETGQGVNGRIDKDALTIEITRPADWPGPHPSSLVPYDYIGVEGLQQALARFAEWLIKHGLESPSSEYRAVRDLLLRRAPRLAGMPAPRSLVAGHPSGSEAARALARSLDATTLAIQGPPGTGKTYSGARMILELIADGRRVGVTGSNHKVITNLLREVWEASDGGLQVLQRIDGEDTEERPWTTAKSNERFDGLRAKEDAAYDVLAGTAWLWARDELAAAVDTLFVDEAGQVALANVVAAGAATRNIVLLGDPQQLDQVLQGSHPPGAAASALGHFVGAAETVPDDRGIFLEATWRMHPRIAAFTSNLFYEDRLVARAELDAQRVLGADRLAGSGVRWDPVEHAGNTNASDEEVDRVASIVESLVGRDWVDRHGETHRLALDDIVIVSPYNAHRLLIQHRIPGARVGTVDKFQGQEAPVSIYTMATSRPEDAPRGVDFLYSLNRLNVATSRARALAIVVGSPALLDAIPRTPAQLRMINGLCALVEAAERTPAPAMATQAP